MSAATTAGGWVCQVDLEHAGEQTSHQVTVSRRDLERWGGGDVVELVERSFDFLLERERPESILRRFDLSVIERYFPEYWSELGGAEGR